MDAVAISLSLLQEAQSEPDLKRLARSYVTRGREALYERQRAGAGGLEIVSAWSTVMDHLIRHLYGAIHAECGKRLGESHRGFALIAQGGYGRGELAYQSQHWTVQPDHVCEDLLDAVHWILKREGHPLVSSGSHAERP